MKIDVVENIDVIEEEVPERFFFNIFFSEFFLNTEFQNVSVSVPLVSCIVVLVFQMYD